MKIVVSNSSKQHTPQLVKAFQLFYINVVFLTSFWFKEEIWYWRILLILPVRVKNELLKRYSKGIPNNIIKFNIIGSILFFFGRFLFETEKKNFIEDLWHDRWVKYLIFKIKPTIVIGYEKSCYKTFKRAKSLGAITILDLAQTHTHFIKMLRIEFPFFRDITGGDYFFHRISNRKLKEYDLADYILTLSTLAKQSLIENGINPQKIRVINLGFNPNQFFAKNNYNSLLNRPLRIIFTGIVTQRKGVNIIASCAKKIIHLPIDFIIIGPKDDGFIFIDNVPNIKYISYLQHNNLVDEFHSSDVFVLPSYLDSWGMVVIEAMACGLPVIVSENTGAKDAVTNECGFIIPINDEIALREKIEYFYYNRSEIERMGKNARKQSERYTWDNYYKQINEFIDSITVKN